MVRRALSVLALACLAWPSSALAQLDVRIPDCASPRVDLALLRELIAIELAGSASYEITVGEQLCDETSTTLELVVHDLATDSTGHDTIPIAVDAASDPRAEARTLALAIAERAPRMRQDAVEASAAPPPEVTPSPAPAAPAPIADHAAELAVPAPPPAEAAPPTARPTLPATLGIGIVGRIAPVLPSWALGLRVDLGAHLDPTWSLRGELDSTWSRTMPSEGQVDAVVIAGAALLGASVYRDASVDVVPAVRGELGALVAIGTLAGGAPNRTTVHAWATLGAQLDVVLTLADGIALDLDVAASGVLAGTRISSIPSGTQIDLSLVVIDLGASVRFAL